VTNQEILERVERIEDTLAIMLRDTAEAAQRLAARHPERPDLLKTVDALLDDIVAKGR
jgi:acetyl-CoA carboxylase alpha subunit